MSDKQNRILFGASYSVIEPLGLLHLGGLARDEGWDREYHLVKDHNYSEFVKQIKDYKPDMVGFNVYTGNHGPAFEAFKQIKKDNPNIQTILGGPHATYFAGESAKFVDYVVMSEGFFPLKSILNGKAEKGILHHNGSYKFPQPDREKFYSQHPEHAKSKIKSVISMTGCPYACTYCYNSTDKKDVMGSIPEHMAKSILYGMVNAVDGSNRLFPTNIRTVDDVVREGKEIASKWPTEMVYFQDDVHVVDLKWLKDFSKRWKEEVGLPYHAQMRWEMTKDTRRLDMIKEAGGFGLTLAIEAADQHIRHEVLDRKMPEDNMYDGMKAIYDRGFKVRTEQITGLPYGATSKETKMNLDADIDLIRLNVDLKEKTGGPTMAWGSTLVPYARTKLGTYCDEHGHYNLNEVDKFKDSFFERSVMRFPKEWIGPSLKERKNDESVWLNEDELNTYRDQNAELRRNFNLFALIPKGHVFANSYLKRKKPFSYERLGSELIEHLNGLKDTNQDAREMLSNIGTVKAKVNLIDRIDPEEKRNLEALVPYFAALPRGTLAVDRYIDYGTRQGKFDNKVLSTAVRHHLYDEVLYKIGDSNQAKTERPIDLSQARISKV